MKYFVSRQNYWGVEPEEGTVVEIAAGGLDFANPDMLVPKWKNLGEGQEFSDPREAVACAIKICQAWRLAGEENAKIACGFTGGNTLPFEPKAIEELEAWAEATYEKLPKCDCCGMLLGKETYGHEYSDGYPFCSEYCSEKDYGSFMNADDEG